MGVKKKDENGYLVITKHNEYVKGIVGADIRLSFAEKLKIMFSKGINVAFIGSDVYKKGNDKYQNRLETVYKDTINLQILLINNICEAAVQHGYDELCDLSNSEGLIASLEDWIKVNNLEDFCHVVYVDDSDCLCGIKIGRKENTSDEPNR